jgi:predicted neutral ceramidase superfamily lipid hydrolase
LANAVAAVVVGLAVALAELGATLEAAEMVAEAAPAVEVGLAVADALAEAETEASPVGVCAAAAETNSATNTMLRLENNNTQLTLSIPFARTFPYGTTLMG